MIKPSQSYETEEFTNFMNGFSGKMKFIDAKNDLIEQKLLKSKRSGDELLNNSFDSAFGLEKTNKE